MDLKDAEMKTRNWEYTRRTRNHVELRVIKVIYTYMKLEI